MKQNHLRKDYFSTFEAAKYCRVTRFTINNWIKNGLIKATRTVGGHRRILRNELISFMQTHNMDPGSLDLHYPEAELKYCWEFHQNGGQSDHECHKCIVYTTRTKRCFALREETNHKKIYCKRNCKECSYYQKLNTQFSTEETEPSKIL